MSSLTLKDIPSELLERLRAAAVSDRRSLMQEVLVILEGALARRERTAARAAGQIEAWRALAGSWRTDESFDDEVTAIYGARTPGRDLEL